VNDELMNAIMDSMTVHQAAKATQARNSDSIRDKMLPVPRAPRELWEACARW
jgi:hypothetical protein